MVGWMFVATVLLPFLIGFWIGNPVFAGLAFAALGFTLLIHQLTLDAGAPEGELVLGILFASLVSSGAAAGGGWVRERQRQRRRLNRSA